MERLTTLWKVHVKNLLFCLFVCLFFFWFLFFFLASHGSCELLKTKCDHFKFQCLFHVTAFYHDDCNHAYCERKDHHASPCVWSCLCVYQPMLLYYHHYYYIRGIKLWWDKTETRSPCSLNLTFVVTLTSNRQHVTMVISDTSFTILHRFQWCQYESSFGFIFLGWRDTHIYVVDGDVRLKVSKHLPIFRAHFGRNWYQWFFWHTNFCKFSGVCVFLLKMGPVFRDFCFKITTNLCDMSPYTTTTEVFVILSIESTVWMQVLKRDMIWSGLQQKTCKSISTWLIFINIIKLFLYSNKPLI